MRIVFPRIAEAMAVGPPSRFERAPRTEFAYTIADDSAHAMLWPRAGTFPTRYGVQLLHTCAPIL